MRHGHRMRRTLIAGLFALLAFATGVSLPGTAKLGLGGPAMAQDGFAIDQFYDELAPYGAWVYHPRHSYVWLPRSAAEGWRPYTVGHWVSTEEYGWYWESYEPFAWAVYHYGRWGYDAGFGWYWVPGDTWAPAWVQWRYGTDYVGWAPVGPSPYGGYAYGGPTGYAPLPAVDSWVFVRQAYLMSNVLYRHVLPRIDVTIALSHTTYVVRPQFRNGHVYNYGMPRQRWSQITRQHIEPRKIHRGHRKARPHGWNGRHGRDLYAYAPNVRKGVKPKRAPKSVHHRPLKANAKAKAEHHGKHYGRAATTQAPRYRAGHKALPRKASAHPGVVYPGRRGSGSAVFNPRVRPKAGGGKRKVSKPHLSKSKVAKAKAHKAKAHKAKAHKAKARSGKSRNAKAVAAKSKAARSKSARAKAAPRNAAKARDARAKTAKARSTKSRNAKAAKGKVARPKTAKAEAARTKTARAKAPRAKAATVGTARKAKAKPAKTKSAKTKSAKTKAAKAKAAKARPPKAKAVKARSANAKPGAGRAGHGGHGKGKKGGRRG